MCETVSNKKLKYEKTVNINGMLKGLEKYSLRERPEKFRLINPCLTERTYCWFKLYRGADRDVVLIRGKYFDCIVDHHKAPPLYSFYETLRYMTFIGTAENSKVAIYDRESRRLWIINDIVPYIIMHVEIILKYCLIREIDFTYFNPSHFPNIYASVHIYDELPIYVSKVFDHYFEVMPSKIIYANLRTGKITLYDTFELDAETSVKMDIEYEEKIIKPLIESDYEFARDGRYVTYCVGTREFVLYRFTSDEPYFVLTSRVLPYPFTNLVFVI